MSVAALRRVQHLPNIQRTPAPDTVARDRTDEHYDIGAFVNKKGAINPRLLAVARVGVIFAQRQAQQLTHAEYQDYLSWVQVMVGVEKQRMVQLGAKEPLSLAMDIEEDALIA